MDIIWVSVINCMDYYLMLDLDFYLMLGLIKILIRGRKLLLISGDFNVISLGRIILELMIVLGR